MKKITLFFQVIGAIIAVATLQSCSGEADCFGVTFPCRTPTLTRSGNVVTIATATAGATLSYTTDGRTTPTRYVGTRKPSPCSVTITSGTTVKAMAYKNCWYDSGVVSQTF